jgi:hypothetical protein
MYYINIGNNEHWENRCSRGLFQQRYNVEHEHNLFQTHSQAPDIKLYKISAV